MVLRSEGNCLCKNIFNGYYYYFKENTVCNDDTSLTSWGVVGNINVE